MNLQLTNYKHFIPYGCGYQIHFPVDDENIGLILDENGTPMYTISRKDFITYQNIYKLQ